MSSFLEPKNSPTNEEKEKAIPVDGFGQVIALLQVADAAFRESLIKRIAERDPSLARQIRATLARN